MPFVRPLLAEILRRIRARLELDLEGSDSTLRRGVLPALSRAQAEATRSLHAHIDWIARQAFADTADADVLARHAAIFAVQPIAATFARLSIEITGSDGATLPEATVLRRLGGSDYDTEADAEIAAGVATLALSARSAGDVGNLEVGAKLTLLSPVAGIDSTATVLATLEVGQDAEDVESLRARVLGEIRQPAHGGARHDYIQWVREVVAGAAVFPHALQFGLGTVGVAFLMPDGSIPDAGTVQAVQDYVDPVAPMTAIVTVYAPTPVPTDPQVSITPDTAEIRAAVNAELADLYLREAVPGGTIPISHLREAISLAAGETDHTLVSPTVSPGVGGDLTQIPALGTVSFV